MHAHHQPLATHEPGESVEMTEFHEHHDRRPVESHKSWLLDSESEYASSVDGDEEDSHYHRHVPTPHARPMVDAEAGNAGVVEGIPHPYRRHNKRHKRKDRGYHPFSTRCSWCNRLFFCCSFRTCKFIILCWIFLFTMSNFGMNWRSSTCWTARDELYMLTRFEENAANGKMGPWPLKNAHSHNDYEQTKPLHEALLAGFCSVEGDVHLNAGALLLGHIVTDVSETFTLEDTYVKPLIEIVKKNDGVIYKRAVRLGLCQQFTLLIDIKTVEKRLETWELLEKMLESLDDGLPDGRPIFQTFDLNNKPILPEGVMLPSPLRVVVTGIPGFEEDLAKIMLSRDKRKTVIDLNSPLESAEVRSVAAWISEKWKFPWPDSNPVSIAATRKALQQRVLYARANGLSVRYWGTPEDPDLWELLLEMGVDLINTDTIFTLNSFLTGRSVASPETP